MTKKAVSYPPSLAKRMKALDYRFPGLLISGDDPELLAHNAKVTREHTEEAIRRMDLLREHYAIPQGHWFVLAYTLAKQTVPGLEVERARAGRKTKWTPIDKAELKIAADNLVAARGISVTSAISSLNKTTGSPWKGKGIPTLKGWYYEADERWVRMVRDAALYDEAVKAGMVKE